MNLGTIDCDSELEITVTFNPVTYTTSNAEISLLISQFDFKPLVCHLQGSCQPFAQSKKERYLIQLSKGVQNIDEDVGKRPRQ
jgi:hypothetical protein